MRSRKLSHDCLFPPGSVKEFVVESVPHSQFISLSTALYDTVVELDRNGRCASRDTIVRYLKDVYHNVRIPSEEIVHTCLGKLIEQRKIYHDGVGYRALIDNSPVHKSQIADQVLEETREFLAKSSFKDSVREKSDGDSACRSSTSVKDAKRRSRRRPNLSDGSKEDTVSKAHSDEDRHRFNMLFLDHVSQISTPMMSKKSSRLYKDGSRKKTAPSSLMCAGKPLLLPSNYMDQADFDQEIKIIDISERMSVLSQGSKSRPKSFQNVVNQAAMGQNGDSFQSPGQPYDKHNRSQQPKRPKPHRSRSFTEPSKHRPKLRSSKAVDKVDFPLRRVMGTEELRVASKRDRDTKSKKKNEKTVVESTSNCKSKDQKRKDRTPGQYDTGDLEHKLKISSEGIQSETILEQYDIVVHDKSNGHHSKNWKINSDTVSMTNTSDAPSIAFSSDTQSFAYTSDTSSPLQIKKRKDICCNHTDKNSNTTHSNGLTCMCLTGKIENGVKASGSDKNSENDDTNAVTNEDDSIFDYVDSEHDAYEYRSCDEDFEIHAEDCLEINRAI